MPLLGMYKKEMKIGSQRNVCIPMITAALLTTAKTTQQSKCPSADKENVVHTHTHRHIHIHIHKYIHTYTHTHTHTCAHICAHTHTHPQSLKKEGNPPPVTKQMKLEGIMLSEVSQRNRYNMQRRLQVGPEPSQKRRADWPSLRAWQRRKWGDAN